jgi:hypothetical protein
MQTGYTYKPSTAYHAGHIFGAVDIIIGTKLVNSRIIRVARNDKEQALQDAGKLARSMVALGVNCPINLRDYQ